MSFFMGYSTQTPLGTNTDCVTGDVFSKDKRKAGQTFEVLPILENQTEGVSYESVRYVSDNHLIPPHDDGGVGC